ncbi:prevent-host-death family protein [Streptosporangium subroseum]|uniref:Antitoxin n=1 Tax=Streptosporangium subroseum TaxID=106412 RepID=A0A239P0M0_9ACTN|nr:type II toxin-antitoxin system prevent-host-death family antitoxin [Streptosporangium subroseum]SNT59909.1 prevent-host-death family protein [Streptosporangium subroseum]
MSEPLSNDHTVGVRDLSHGTGQVLSRVKAGETLIITERGEPIAVVIPLRQPRTAMPAVGYATSGDPTWASHADENLGGFGE